MCGTAPWQWDEAQGGSRRAFEAVETFCHGCYAKAAAQSHDPNRNTDGITVDLVRGDGSDAARRLLKQTRRAREGRA